LTIPVGTSFLKSLLFFYTIGGQRQNRTADPLFFR